MIDYCQMHKTRWNSISELLDLAPFPKSSPRSRSYGAASNPGELQAVAGPVAINFVENVQQTVVPLFARPPLRPRGSNLEDAEGRIPVHFPKCLAPLDCCRRFPPLQFSGVLGTSRGRLSGFLSRKLSMTRAFLNLTFTSRVWCTACSTEGIISSWTK